MVIFAEVDEDGLEGLGYDIRIDCNKGRGVYATKGLLKKLTAFDLRARNLLKIFIKPMK